MHIDGVASHALPKIRSNNEFGLVMLGHSHKLLTAAGRAKGRLVMGRVRPMPSPPLTGDVSSRKWLTTSDTQSHDQLIIEFFDKDDPAGGWVHISYHESGSNRKQVLTFDGKKYSEGLPEMKWSGGKVVN